MAKTYDPKCHDLAEHFLSDDDTSKMTAKRIEARTVSLAQAIQTAIENWYEDEELYAAEQQKYEDEMRSLRGYTDEERARI